MKLALLLGSISICNCVYASISNDLFMYDFHREQLSKTWWQDRIIRPAHYAGLISLASMATVLYIAYRFDDFNDIQGVLCAAGLAGCISFLLSFWPLVTLKFLIRILRSNAREDSLKQTLAVITVKMKSLIADGRITMDDLEYCKEHYDSPLLQELIQYTDEYRSLHRLSASRVF